MDKYKFGEYIYKKRKKQGLTQDELGRKLGVTNKAVSKWEVGETLPDITILPNLAEALEITVDELLSQTDKVKEEIKVKNTKITKSKKNLIFYLLIGLLGCLLLVSIIFNIISLVDDNTETSIIEISNENINEIVKINPSSQIISEEDMLIIDSTYQLNENYSYNNEDVSFTVVYQFIYYYYLNDGTVGVVTYYNRFYDVVLNQDNQEAVVNIALEPKFDLNDFKGFKQVKISYIILNSEGTVVKTVNE